MEAMPIARAKKSRITSALHPTHDRGTLLNNSGLDEVLAEEMAVFPGM
jgi:hypothetical protein